MRGRLFPRRLVSTARDSVYPSYSPLIANRIMTTKTRRTEEQLIAELEAKIAALKNRAEAKKVKKDPALKYVSAAMRSLDKAMAETEDKAMRKALEEARGTLSACLSLNGVTLTPKGSSVKRGVRGGAVDRDTLLDYVRKHPGQRGEEISAALGTDSKLIRPVMKRLIEEGAVATRGERRGMQYSPA